MKKTDTGKINQNQAKTHQRKPTASFRRREKKQKTINFTVLSALLHFSYSSIKKSKKRGDAVVNVKLLKCLLSSLLPPPPPLFLVPKTHVVYPLRGSGIAALVGGTQRNHRAYLSLLPLTLNYSLKPPEFLQNKTLQSATRGSHRHTD